MKLLLLEMMMIWSKQSPNLSVFRTELRTERGHSFVETKGQQRAEKKNSPSGVIQADFFQIWTQHAKGYHFPCAVPLNNTVLMDWWPEIDQKLNFCSIVSHKYVSKSTSIFVCSFGTFMLELHHSHLPVSIMHAGWTG